MIEKKIDSIALEQIKNDKFSPYKNHTFKN
jgi:hypothetical protein